MRCAWPALLLACVVLLPHLGKAFTIDDTLFLRQAQHALTDPLHPTAFSMVWFDQLQRVSTIMPSGPLMAWLLMPALACGGSEVVAHLTVLGVFLCAILAVTSLAFRMGLDFVRARLTGLFLVAMPAVLAMSATVMPDTAAMAFGVIGVERALAYGKAGRWSQGAAAILCLGLAPAGRLHEIFVVGVALLLLIAQKATWKRFWPVVLAPLLTAFILAISHDEQSGTLDAARAFASQRHLLFNAAAFCSNWTFSMFLPVGWALLRWRRVLAGRGIWAAVPTSVWLLTKNHAISEWFWGIGMALTICVMLEILLEAWDRRDLVQGTLGLWLLAAFPLVIYAHMPPKYLVASAPAAALLLAQATDWSRMYEGTVASLGIAFGLLLGFLIVRADANFAGHQREAVDSEIAPRVARGERVYFSGHWGFQWYAERAGAEPLVRGLELHTGAIVVECAVADPKDLLLQYPNRELVKTLSDRTPGGRIMNSSAKAGFYSNLLGPYPWVWSDAELDLVTVWRIR